MQENTIKEICFYIPLTHTISGGLFFFYKLAHYCSTLDNIKVYIVNYSDTKYTEIFKEKYDCSNIIFLDYEDKNIASYFSENTIFITQIQTLQMLLESFKIVSLGKIFLLNIHPEANKFLTGNLRLKKQKTFSKIFEVIKDNNAVAFMDKTCLDSTINHSGVEFLPNYIPAFIDKTNTEYQNKNLVSEDEINIGLVCRLDVDKIQMVINFLNNVYNLESEKRINVHIIGDGTHKNQIDITKYKEKFKIILTSYLYGDELKEYISKNIDMMFNFGIAALDIASMKLPVAIPIYEMQPHEIDRYYFLFDSKYYNLGCNEELADKYELNTHTIKEILDMIYIQKQKEFLGNKCYEYLIENHMLEFSAAQFLKLCNQSTLTVEDCLKIKSIKKTVTHYGKYKHLGYYWDNYIKIRNFKPKYKMYFKFVELFKNNKITSTIWYKIYIHFVKRIRRKGVTINAQNCRDFEILQIAKRHEKYITKVNELKNKLKHNKKIKVAFLVIYDAAFPGENLFKQMIQDEIFEPYILVIPDITRGEENKFYQMEKTYNTLSEKYPNFVYKSWDDKKKEFIDFSKKMDIFCSANPYDSMTYKLYRIGKLARKNILSVYFNYGYPAVTFARRVASLDSLSLTWKLFSESKYALEEYTKVMPIKGKNLVLSGYIKMDSLYNQEKQKRTRKKIIIAPHHTIESKFKSSIGLSNFLQYSDFFKELPKLYPQIDFVFRPHQLLKVTLEKESIWGIEETEKYFKEIQENPNLIYQEGGDYFETFANSDGIIHDCSSFMTEYMFTKNPSCYILANQDSIDKYFMDNGKETLKHYYQAYKKEDILNYIDNVILAGIDPMKEEREKYVENELMVNYPNVSKYVIDYIKKEIL